MFMDGDVLFTWNVNNTEGYNVSITKDNAGTYWKHVTDTQYTVKNAWSYTTIEINVHRLMGEQVGTSTYTGKFLGFLFILIYRNNTKLFSFVVYFFKKKD